VEAEGTVALANTILYWLSIGAVRGADDGSAAQTSSSFATDLTYGAAATLWV
jgi:hypothetical protein